jgi:hypothetical protein
MPNPYRYQYGQNQEIGTYIPSIHDQGQIFQEMPFIRGVHDQGIQEMPYFYGRQDQQPPLQTLPNVRGFGNHGPAIEAMPNYYGSGNSGPVMQPMPYYNRGQYSGQLIDRIKGPTYQPSQFSYEPNAQRMPMTPDLRSRLMQQDINLPGGKKGYQSAAQGRMPSPVQSWNNVPNDPQSLYNMRMAGYENQGKGTMSDEEARAYLTQRFNQPPGGTGKTTFYSPPTNR